MEPVPTVTANTPVEAIMNDDYREQQNIEVVSQPEFADLLDEMWKALKKFWVYLVGLIILLSVAFYAYARIHYVPEYTATSTFTVTSSNASRSSSSYNQAVATQMGKVFPYLLSSDAMTKLVAEDLGLSYVPGRIETETLFNTNMMTLSVTAEDPTTAYDILQSIIKNYPSVTEYILGDVTLNLVDGSGKPSSPSNQISYPQQILRGAVIGLVLALLLLYFYAATRKTVKKEKDLNRVLNVTCLATLPQVRMKKRSNNKRELVLIDYEHIPNYYVESVRNLRTRVVNELPKKKNPVLLISSAMSGEGKTTVAANLALSMAQRGYKVLVVDGDLRKPALTRAFGIKKAEKGFVDLIQGDAELSDVVVKYPGASLNIISGGKESKNASSILKEERIGTLIQNLKQYADLLIIDAPPSAVVADAAVYAKFSDAVIYVVRQDYARYNDIINGVELLSDTKVRIMGCVLNDAVAGLARSYSYSYANNYGYGYGYGYGYDGYGYGDDELQKQEKERQESAKAEENNTDDPIEKEPEPENASAEEESSSFD